MPGGLLFDWDHSRCAPAALAPRNSSAAMLLAPVPGVCLISAPEPPPFHSCDRSWAGLRETAGEWSGRAQAWGCSTEVIDGSNQPIRAVFPAMTRGSPQSGGDDGVIENKFDRRAIPLVGWVANPVAAGKQLAGVVRLGNLSRG